MEALPAFSPRERRESFHCLYGAVRARKIGGMTTTEGRDLQAIEAERARIRDAHLRPAGQRPAPTARWLHPPAVIRRDGETAVHFYQGVLGFPLTELIENRDYPGSSHFFFDIGNGNL